MMSDTPRTDAYCKQILEDGLGLEYAATELQHFAEKLERDLVDARAELAEAKAKITMLKGEAQYGVDLFQRAINAERELAYAQKDAERYKWLRVRILDAITINDAAMKEKNT